MHKSLEINSFKHITMTKPDTSLLDSNTCDKNLLDADGHLKDHTLWSAGIAQQLAQTLNLKLDDTHMQILLCVRDFYARFEYAPATRPIIKFLSKELPELPISNAYLQEQFNTGLVARHLSRLAGLPKPANCL